MARCKRKHILFHIGTFKNRTNDFGDGFYMILKYIFFEGVPNEVPGECKRGSLLDVRRII